MTALGPLSPSTTSLYEKIANLETYSLSETEIASTCGVTVGRVSQILSDAGYQSFRDKAQAESTQTQHQINEGWSAVEENALAVVLNHIQEMAASPLTADPDYALRAAMVANKRQVRVNPHNVPLEPGSGKVIQLTLTQNFVTANERPATAQAGNGSTIDLSAEKTNDFMNSNTVQAMLGGPGPETQEQLGENLESVTFEQLLAQGARG